MGLACIYGGRECTGCMACRKEGAALGRCVCGQRVLEGQEHYVIHGQYVHWDCLRDWAEAYLAG